MPVTLARDQALCVLQLEEEIDIRCAAELKQALVDALATGTGLQIDFARATQVDITAIQLLWAAQREADRKGVALAAAGPVPERIRLELVESGFEKLLPGAANGPDQAMESPANMPEKVPEEDPPSPARMSTIDKYKQAFLEEARERLVELEGALLALSQTTKR